MRKTAKEWSTAELAKLMEGMAMYDMNWDEIANHIGTRSAD